MNFNKGDDCPMKLLMGSTAFGAVARSVHVVEKDPDCPGERLFATVKANMGRDDLPMLRFRLGEATVDTADGAAVVLVAVGLGEDSSGRSFEDVQRRMRRDALAADRQTSGVRTVTEETVEFLTEWMRAHDYSGKSAGIKAAAKGLDIPERTLQVARARMRIEVSSRAGFGGGNRLVLAAGRGPRVGGLVTVVQAVVRSCTRARGLRMNCTTCTTCTPDGNKGFYLQRGSWGSTVVQVTPVINASRARRREPRAGQRLLP